MSSFSEFLTTIRHLRGPQGCPWDQVQTIQSLTPHLLEEMYEFIVAAKEGNRKDFADEMGDVLLVVLMIAVIAEESEKDFIRHLFRRAREKLITRHPHVFSDAPLSSPEEVKAQWNQIKEKKEEKPPIHAPSHFPPLERAFRLQKQAARKGFDWTNVQEVYTKVREELRELEETDSAEAQQEELGDLLFSVINLSRVMRQDAGTALHLANEKFYRRCNYVLRRAEEMNQHAPADLHRFWEESKRHDQLPHVQDKQD